MNNHGIKYYYHLMIKKALIIGVIVIAVVGLALYVARDKKTS